MAARFGYASENENWANQQQDDEQKQQFRRQSRRATLRPTTGANAPHQITFKPFTKESLAEAEKRKLSHQSKRRSNQQQQQQPHRTYKDKDGVELLSVARDSNATGRVASATITPMTNAASREPDPYLASGQQLPPAIMRHLPRKLVGKPIEDIDPYYADKETFVIISRGNELIRFSAKKALYLLDPFHPIRKVVLYILVSSTFNLIVILTILTNCVLMTIQGSEEKPGVDKTEIVFTIIYTIEMALKVLARGFIMDHFTYLRDPWNWLDFAVIVMAYLTIVVEDLGNLSVIRTFRVLRALKTVAIISGMKTIVGAVIDSVKNLKDVVVLTLFSLSVFSLLGLQIYMGLLTQKCIENGPLNMTDWQWHEWCSQKSHWIKDNQSEIFGNYRLCGNSTGAQSCPRTHTCLQGFGPNPDYGFTSFDTFGWALISSFRLMTQDYWEGLYMQVLKTAGSWHILFFIVSIFLGSIYLMNLILAIVAMSYNELQRRAEEEEEAAAEDEAAFLETCRLMELQDQMSDRYSHRTGSSNGTIERYYSSNHRRRSKRRNRGSHSVGGSVGSSYRPSIEIGLVGQSMLASLCQNGLLGEYVRQKLETQMIRAATGEGARSRAGEGPSDNDTGNQQRRSHSLSVNLELRKKAGMMDGIGALAGTAAVASAAIGFAGANEPPTYPRSARGSFCKGHTHNYGSPAAGGSPYYYQQQQQQLPPSPPPQSRQGPPTPTAAATASTMAREACSMTELRRRSSTRSAQIVKGPNHHLMRLGSNQLSTCVRSNSLLASVNAYSDEASSARRRRLSARSTGSRLSPIRSIAQYPPHLTAATVSEQRPIGTGLPAATAITTDDVLSDSARSSRAPSLTSRSSTDTVDRRSAIIRIVSDSAANGSATDDRPLLLPSTSMSPIIQLQATSDSSPTNDERTCCTIAIDEAPTVVEPAAGEDDRTTATGALFDSLESTQTVIASKDQFVPEAAEATATTSASVVRAAQNRQQVGPVARSLDFVTEKLTTSGGADSDPSVSLATGRSAQAGGSSRRLALHRSAITTNSDDDWLARAIAIVPKALREPVAAGSATGPLDGRISAQRSSDPCASVIPLVPSVAAATAVSTVTASIKLSLDELLASASNNSINSRAVENQALVDMDGSSVAICGQPTHMYPFGRSRCMLSMGARNYHGHRKVASGGGSQSVGVSRRSSLVGARSMVTPESRQRPGDVDPDMAKAGTPPASMRLNTTAAAKARPLSPILAPNASPTPQPKTPGAGLRARGTKLGGSMRALPTNSSSPTRQVAGKLSTGHHSSPTGELYLRDSQSATMGNKSSGAAAAAAVSRQQLAAPMLPPRFDRIHLSVENFQQFGAIHPAQQQHRLGSAGQVRSSAMADSSDLGTDTSSSLRAPQVSPELSASSHSINPSDDRLSSSQRASVQYRALDGSAANINPLTMIRSSFSRARLPSHFGPVQYRGARSAVTAIPNRASMQTDAAAHYDPLLYHPRDVTGVGPTGARRMSRDFIRRASNWSRLSMGANVDLRRLLRLWLHTNPYQGTGSGLSIAGLGAGGTRPSLGSCSSRLTGYQQAKFPISSRRTSQRQSQHYIDQDASNNGYYVHPFWSNRQQQPMTANSSRVNTPRPSSVGSTWQAYELMSAMSRRQNMLKTNLNANRRYGFNSNNNRQHMDGATLSNVFDYDCSNNYEFGRPDTMVDVNEDDLEDMYAVDNVSINMRDKCVAYCLSCMDIICIWECCGAWLQIQRLIAFIVFDPFTELFIILCILINTLFMALDTDDADPNMRNIFEGANYFFSATFAVEAFMKIMALSPKFYFRDGWNVFDAVIVCLSLLELGLQGVYIPGLSVLRSFRLLRVFKLAKSWPTLNLLISIMGKAVGDLGNLTFVLAIIVFIFAVMGMQLFGSKYQSKNFPSGEVPRWNFTDFMHSFMIVFRILCAEWIEPMWDCLLVDGWPCIPFFLIAVVVGNLVVLNLFLALLLASFGASNLSSPQVDNVDTRKLQEAIRRFRRFYSWIRWNVYRSIRSTGRYLVCGRWLSKDKGADRRKKMTNHTGDRVKYHLANDGRGDDDDNDNRASTRPAITPDVTVIDEETDAQKLTRAPHFVSMSRSERLRNIELRTEELKNRISRSPEHHYHLRQLAQMQLKKAATEQTRRGGFNYHYEHRTDENRSIEPMPNIPIIVDEAADLTSAKASSSEGLDAATSAGLGAGTEGDAQSGGLDMCAVTRSNELSASDLSHIGDPIREEEEERAAETDRSIAGYIRADNGCVPNNMQPIKEDSKDVESSLSVESQEIDEEDETNQSNQQQYDQPAAKRDTEFLALERGQSLSSFNRQQQLANRTDSYDQLSTNEGKSQHKQQPRCQLFMKCVSTGGLNEQAGASSTFGLADYSGPSNLAYHSTHLIAATGAAGAGAGSGVGEAAISSDHQSRPDAVQPKSSALYLRAPKRQEMEEDDERDLQHIETYLESYLCLGMICFKWFMFRQRVRRLVEHQLFDQIILLLIVFSSGTLALEDIHLKERPVLKRTLDIMDTVFTIIFSLEMIMKWLAFGMKRYFGNIWSWLDFSIVLVSFINLMASVFGSGKIQAFKTMRTLRAMRGLRPLRALQRFQGMRVVVNALIQAIPSIFNVLLVCLIFWLIFAIMGVQMFGGKFWRCLDENDELLSADLVANKYACNSTKYTWSNPQINFDNVLNAYLALFQVATFKGWIDIMNSAVDARGRDEQPIREANIHMYFYFVLFVIFGSFFTLNLFIGVIIDNFNEQKKKTGGSLEIFMTDDQKKYYHAMKKMRSKKPIKAMTRPKLKLQAYMFDITTSKRFDLAIMIIIGLNMFVMALEHYHQSPEFGQALEMLNLIFIAIFTLECLAKIFAMRHFYFREPWNIFDFIVVCLSLLGVVTKEYVAKYLVSPTLLRVVRVVKVGRVLRLVKGAKGIRTLLFALAMSLPALFNICLLLFLVMFIYAIFGMSFFMHVRKRSGLDETFNFETFTSSIIVLFQMSTSAGWDLVLDPLMDEENDCEKPDPNKGTEGNCGNKSIAIFYLITYVIVTFLIIINMYIAVILENYSQATEDVQEGLTDDDYEMYYEIWQKFDPNGTQYLPFEKLSDFVDALEDPLRIPKPNDLALVVLDINIYEGNQCYCVDILDALTKHFFSRKGLYIQVNEHLQKVQSTLHETPFERITTTFLLKRQHYCAKVIQNHWRRWRNRVLAKRPMSIDDSNGTNI